MRKPRRKTQKIQFNQEIQINDSYSFMVEKVSSGTVIITEYETTNSQKIVTDQYEGTPEEIEKFIRRDYEMIISLPIIGF